MANSPRIRTIKTAWEELHQIDPQSAISKNYLRTLVINGIVPSHKAGSKYLVDLDKLLQYLAGDTQTERESK